MALASPSVVSDVKIIPAPLLRTKFCSVVAVVDFTIICCKSKSDAMKLKNNYCSYIFIV